MKDIYKTFQGAGIFHLSDSSTVAPPPGGDRGPPCGAGRDGGRLRAGNDFELLDFGTSSSLHQERTAKHGRAQRPNGGQTKNITQSLSPPQQPIFSKGHSSMLPQLCLPAGSSHISPLIILLLLLSGQCPNPGPTWPCGVCNINVTRARI